jgi:intraflagellar transport protein 122
LDIPSKTIVFKDEKAKSAAFNTEIEELICYSFDGSIYVKTAAFPSISEKISGVVVGFKGTKVFLLQSSNTITSIDISHSSSITRYIEKKDYSEAYKVACLGATKQELTLLGFEALSNFDLVVAINCFIKLGDIRYINLVFKIENDLKDKVNKDIILAEILSYQGKYNEAAQCYIKGNMPERAAEMYSTLKKWAEAIDIIKKFLNRKDFPTLTDSLLSSQADWLMETGKFKEAGDLYMMLGKTKKAIEVYGQKGFLENLIEICRNLNKVESSELIKMCGEYFKKNNHHGYAKEAYLKLGDIKSLMQLHIELKKWDEAFLLAKQNEQLTEYINLEYAKFLLNDDKFEDAQQAYKRAGRVDLSMNLLEQLIDNAVCEKRFKERLF